MSDMSGVTAQQMAEIDRRAQEEYGISQSELMENAGRSVAEVILSDYNSLKNEKIAVICGRGNNGGDGFVAARFLLSGYPSRLTVYVSDPEKIKQGAALLNFQRIRDLDIEALSIKEFISSEGPSGGYTISVDALFGTGFKGELPEDLSLAGKILNSSDLTHYAVDIPSGLDATTGLAAEDCFKADKTVTFGLPKRGFFKNAGPEVCGEIIVKDIGFPPKLLQEYL
jgi:hydroxyethylthiazole kinase-like uncharacterized protein yjeF